MRTQAERASAFRALHQRPGIFVMPNPWDAGTAKLFASLGFEALATTSLGLANALGRVDGALAVSREDLIANCQGIAAATDLPVNADFEGGYAHEPEGVTESVRLCVETGVAGLSIEDATGDKAKPLYDLDLAVARMKAARAAIDRAGGNVLLTGRAECFLVGRPDLDETVRRLQAYSAAGADCLYAPGIRTPELIAAVVKAAAPKPVNVLMLGALGLTVADLAALGVRRISVGGTLARVAWGAFIRTAKTIASEGRFDAFKDAVPHAEINGFLRDDMTAR